jgi:glyoxylase-like metal-dependent hydrolase (beta-lactamase superfamily II)
MLNVQYFTFNPFQENTYIISNDKKQCWIVDPGMFDANETKLLLDFINENGLQPQAIINTHAHIDHILGVDALVEKFNIPFSLHEKDMPVLQSAKASAAMFGFDITGVPRPTSYITEGQPLMLGNDEIEVRFTPGHSPGSIIFYYPKGKWAIVGDVLFAGSIGRTDLPGGSYGTLINSIKTHLLTLPDDTVVYPGHGPATNIGTERNSNPFLV